MIKLRNWSLTESYSYKDNKFYAAHGVVSGHHRLEDGSFVNTSKVVSFKRTDNTVIMNTHSGSEYELDLAYINMNSFDMTSKILSVFNVAIDKDECEKLIKEAEESFISNIDSLLSDNELYMQLSGVFVQRAFFKKAGLLKEVNVSVHSGMFQDSYLVTDWDNGVVDFRYFDRFAAIEPYHWSDGLEALKIDNIGTMDIKFLSGNNIVCKVGEVTTINKDQYKGEGLMSPDAVNGKCMLKGDSK